MLLSLVLTSSSSYFELPGAGMGRGEEVTYPGKSRNSSLSPVNLLWSPGISPWRSSPSFSCRFLATLNSQGTEWDEAKR